MSIVSLRWSLIIPADSTSYKTSSWNKVMEYNKHFAAYSTHCVLWPLPFSCVSWVLHPSVIVSCIAISACSLTNYEHVCPERSVAPLSTVMVCVSLYLTSILFAILDDICIYLFTYGVVTCSYLLTSLCLWLATRPLVIIGSPSSWLSTNFDHMT